MNIEMQPVAWVENQRKTPLDDDWGSVDSVIRLDDSVPATALKGLEQFSHAHVLFFMHQVPENKAVAQFRAPRNNDAWGKFGSFAQRNKARPNRIGLTIAEVTQVEGSSLYVRGLDAIDGTPVLDIKPCFKEFEPRGAIVQPEWVAELMQHYW